MTTRLSTTQQEALSRMPLVRYPGGFWGAEGATLDPFSGSPGWSVGVQTIRALERMGLVTVERNEQGWERRAIARAASR